MVVRHQQIDRRRRTVPERREQPALAAEQGGEAGDPPEMADMPLIADRLRLAAPRRGDRRDKTLRPMTRHQTETSVPRRRGKGSRGIRDDQMLGIGQFDPIDPGRRPAPGTRQQAREIEDDHPTVRSNRVLSPNGWYPRGAATRGLLPWRPTVDGLTVWHFSPRCR